MKYVVKQSFNGLVSAKKGDVIELDDRHFYTNDLLKIKLIEPERKSVKEEK